MNSVRCEIDFPLLATLTPAERLRHGFMRPVAIHRADRIADVVPVLDAVADASRRGHWCVGFIAHEAAPAFDQALAVGEGGGRMLAWFGEFAAPTAPIAVSGLTDTAGSIAGYQLGDWHSDLDYDEFRQKIESIRADIRDGRFYQVNLTTRLAAAFSGDALAFYRALQSSQPNGYHAFVDTGDAQLLSVSPELFFSLQGGKLTAQPMKGTAARGDTAEADRRIAWELTHSAKERAENLMIVDLLRNDLSRIARPQSVEVASLFALQPLPSVWQMTSTINATLKEGVGLAGVFSALFPCGSVTGAPKIEAMRAIRDLESSARGAYCGAIGYVAPAVDGALRACFNVGIRSVWVEAGRACCGVGGGVTWDSSAAGEWAEVIYKSRFVKRATRPFELLETLRLEQGTLPLLERHLARIENSARHFRFAFDAAAVRAALFAAAVRRPQGPWRLRLLLSATGHLRVETAALDPLPAAPRVSLALTPVSSYDEFLQHKTTRRETYEAHAPRDPALFDTLLWNERGELTEFTRANLIVRRGGVDFTPPLSAGLLNGTLRDELVAAGTVIERTLTPADLDGAERLEWVNSLRGRVHVALDAPAASPAHRPMVSAA